MILQQKARELYNQLPIGAKKRAAMEAFPDKAFNNFERTISSLNTPDEALMIAIKAIGKVSKEVTKEVTDINAHIQRSIRELELAS